MDADTRRCTVSFNRPTRNPNIIPARISEITPAAEYEKLSSSIQFFFRIKTGANVYNKCTSNKLW